MNFASAPFLLLFLPTVLIIFHAIRGKHTARLRMAFLVVASAAFYLASGWQNGAVLGASIAGNFLAARVMLAIPDTRRTTRRKVMWLAVVFDLALLLAFKIRILGADSPDGFTAAEDVLLPLALSFVTFQQIGFIASIQRGTIREVTLPRYLFFILFFPQLVLGPIIRFEDVVRQLDEGALARVDPRWVATGLAVFAFALCKKLVVANNLGLAVDDIFATAQQQALPLGVAWYAVVAFQLQLFFDFTAYGEMAIGLAMMLGMRVPLNFDRPLFARDRADLWRRWHISFATFIRGNVFLPLARVWKWPIWLALAVTGILSGLWHGLGVTFVIWGLLQTSILLWLHWRTVQRRRSGARGLPVPLAIATTFLVTCLIGALFRSPDIEAARNIYGSLAGLGGIAGSGGPPGPRTLAFALLAAAIIWIGPDFGQFFRGQWRFTELRRGVRPPPRHWSEHLISFRPDWRWGVVSALAVCAALFALVQQDGASRFIYVQF